VLLLSCVPNVQLSVLLMSTLLLRLAIFLLLFLKLLSDVGVSALDETRAFAGDPAVQALSLLLSSSFLFPGVPLPASLRCHPHCY
jgi:hypothetical protein